MKTHLNEKSLGTLLKILFGEESVQSQVSIHIEIKDAITEKVVKRRYVVDYLVQHKNKTYIVEFDGFRHFQNSKNQFRDSNVLDYCLRNFIGLIQIPYFVQPDLRLFEYLFGFSFNPKLTNPNQPRGFSEFVIGETPEIDWEYPHGFVSKECLRPADFNIRGWNLFTEFCNDLIKNGLSSIFNDIFNSLKNESGDYPQIWLPTEIDRQMIFAT